MPVVRMAIDIIGKEELYRRIKVYLKSGLIKRTMPGEPPEGIALAQASIFTVRGNWTPEFEEKVKSGNLGST